MAKRLIQRAHNRDGLPEMAVGLTFLVVGALSYAQAVLPRESIFFKAAVVSLSLLIPVLCIGSPQAVKWVRRRYLIERAGYVEFEPIGRRQIGLGIVLAVLVTAAIFEVNRFSQPDRWVLAGTGLLGGAIAAFSGRRPRFVLGGLLMAATGMAIAYSGLPLQNGFAILFGLQGLLAFLSGGVVLLRFLRRPMDPDEIR